MIKQVLLMTDEDFVGINNFINNKETNKSYVSSISTSIYDLIYAVVSTNFEWSTPKRISSSKYKTNRDPMTTVNDTGDVYVTWLSSEKSLQSDQFVQVVYRKLN